MVITISANDLREKRKQKLAELPPSAKLAFLALHKGTRLTADQISDATLLPERTTRHALKQLKEADLVEDRPHPAEPRRLVYTACDIAGEYPCKTT